MEYTDNIDRLEKFLIENDVCTEDELSLVESINGRWEKPLMDILEVRTGLRSLEQAADENFIMDSVLEDLDKSMLSESRLEELGLLEEDDDE